MAARQYQRILTPPKGSFFLYEVRRVGKSTRARETFPDAHVGELPRLTRRILVYFGDRHLRTEDGIDVWPHLVNVDVMFPV